jgi:hypothetical protein
MTRADFLSLEWQDEKGALIEPPFPSPILADPSFLFPSETPDGRWHLYAHTVFGIHHYNSPEGLVWADRGLERRNAMRAFVRKIKGEYILLYERYRPFAIPMQILPRRPRWHSHIEMRRSADLITWSRPEAILKPDFPWARHPDLGESISNPCLVKIEPGWRLWFSASLVTIPDCGFDEPRYIGCAHSASLAGPFTIENQPRLDPALNRLPGALGAGSLKVLELDDGWIGLQNKIYAGPDGRSRSAIFILSSGDGLDFTLAREEPLLAPSAGWRSSHVYACDCRIDSADDRVYLYYNARDGWYKKEGRERIGRIVGRTATARGFL